MSGQVKVIAHRDVVQRVKTIQVRREGRRWMLILSCDDVPANPRPATGASGWCRCRDRQFRHHLSDGDHVAQSALGSHCRRRGWLPPSSGWPAPTRGSNNRGRRRETVAARHRKIANLPHATFTTKPPARSSQTV